MERAILDTGVMLAAVLRRDPHHSACGELLTSGQWESIVPGLCVTELAQLLERGAGPMMEATFIESLASANVYEPIPADWPRIAELIRQYADFPLGTVDASVVALAERLDVRTIMTLDRRHFGAVRPAHVPAFVLLP
jgi:uncharacterized protein